MSKVKIVLFTLDTAYAEYFSNFMRNPENSMKFSTKIFTNVDAFKNNIRNQKQHILLTDYHLEAEETSNFDEVIKLSEDKSSESEKGIIVFKYQPLNELLSQVLSIHYEHNGKMDKSLYGDNKDIVISFYSGGAGTGKTTLSLCLAKHLAMQNKRVFYLSLEQLHTTYLFFKEPKTSSAEVFYYLKNNTDRLMSKIESLKSHDALTNMDYFTFPVLPEEMEMLEDEDVKMLVHSLKETEEYDYIIIDLDASIHERNNTAMEISDEVFWILSSNETSMERSKYMLDNDLLGVKMDKSKMHYILNKVGSNLFKGYNSYNFSIETKIPFNPYWLETDEQEKVLEDTVVGEKLAKLIEKNPDLHRQVGLVEN
ncbi:AAA family ATPase [Virgibacillus oceani]